MPGITPPRGPSGIELGYAERTTNATFTSTTAAAATGLSVTIPATDRPIMVEIWVPDVLHSSATQYVGMYIFEDGTAIGQAFAVPGTVANPLNIKRRRLASGSSRTYAAYGAAQSATGTWQMGTGAVGAYAPGFIRVTEG